MPCNSGPTEKNTLKLRMPMVLPTQLVIGLSFSMIFIIHGMIQDYSRREIVRVQVHTENIPCRGPGCTADAVL
jgi:hypothetical protein